MMLHRVALGGTISNDNISVLDMYGLAPNIVAKTLSPSSDTSAKAPSNTKSNLSIASFPTGGLSLLEAGWTLGPNLLTNPDFQSGLNGWDAGGTTWSLDPKTTTDSFPSLRLSDANRSTLFPITTNVTGSVPGANFFTLGATIKTSGMRGPTGMDGARAELFGSDGSILPTVSGTSNWTTESAQHATLAAGGSAAFRVDTFGKPSGEAWFKQLDLQQELPPPLRTYLLYPNWRGIMWSDQSQVATFDVQVNPPAGLALADAQASFKVQNSAGTTVETFQLPPGNSHFTAALDLSSLPAGTYTVTGCLLNSSNQSVVFTQSGYTIQMLSASLRSTLKTYIDSNNVTYLNGNPKFVLGIYDTEGYSTNPQYYASHLAFLAQAPLDGIINYAITSASIAAVDAYTQAMAPHNLHLFAVVNDFFTNDQFYPKPPQPQPCGSSNQDSLISCYAAQLASNPQVSGYYVQDEPDVSLVSETFHQYGLIKANDPGSFTMGTFLLPTQLDWWKDAVDVIATDTYPLGRGPLTDVGDRTRTAVQAVHGARPVWAVVQYWQQFSSSNFPTAQELHDMSWIAITEGALGVFYWSAGQKGLEVMHDVPWSASTAKGQYWLVRDSHGNVEQVTAAGTSGANQPAWATALGGTTQDGAVTWTLVGLNESIQQCLYMELVGVTTGIKALEPVLLQPDSPVLSSNSQAGTVITKEKNSSLGRCVITYNHSASNSIATFTLMQTAHSISVYGENRTIPLDATGTMFTDTYAPAQAHVYQVM